MSSYTKNWRKSRLFLGLLAFFFLFSFTVEGAEVPSKEMSKKKDATFLGVKKLNTYIPDSLKKKLKVGLQVRQRFEFHENKFDGIDGGTFDNDGIQLLRTRFKIDYRPVKMFRLFLQLQDARMWDARSNPIPGQAFYEDYLDVHQLYADFMLDLGGKKSLTVRLGRQQLSYGGQRLIGGFNWNNVSHFFDGMKAMLSAGKLKVDVFAVRRAIPRANKWDNWDEHDSFYGMYLRSKHLKNNEIHFYTLFRETDGKQKTAPTGRAISEATVGFRLKGKKKAFDYTAEMAYQFGKYSTGSLRKEIGAYAWILEAGYTCPCPSKHRFGIEIDYASGDRTPGTGSSSTFDNLYPTNHLFYGFLDMQSLQNMYDFALHYSMKPEKKYLVKVDMHFLFLDTGRDGWYHAGRGAPGTRGGVAAGSVPTFVGSELDLVGKYKANTFLSFLVGYSHFWAGKFPKFKGRVDDAEMFYFQTVINF